MAAEPAKFVWSPNSVDGLIATLSNKAEGVRVNANKKVMLRAASRDMLTVVGPLRDLLELAAKGDKEMLKQVFGGSGIRRFHSIRDILEKTPLKDEMCKDDIRYIELKRKMDIIEEILKQLGLFKMWDMSKGIAGLIYQGVPKRIVQGTHYRFTPDIVDGGEPTEYILEKGVLPVGMTFNAMTGIIVGTVPVDVTPSTTECNITASNMNGSASTTFTLDVAPLALESLAYPGLLEVYPHRFAIHEPPDVKFRGPRGELVKLEQEQIADKELIFAVEPALPQGLAIISSTGYITGKATKATPKNV
jgi:hypothetical protein